MARYPAGSTAETRDKEPKKAPRVRAVIERRLQNPFGDGSPKIELKDPTMTTHVINTTVRPGRYHDVTRNKGWEPVTPEDLTGNAEDYGFDVKEGRVVRGERGQEVLMKMPTADVQAIAEAKDRKNREAASPRRLKAETIALAGAEHGDQAADYINRMTTIKDERAPVPLEGDEPGT